MDINQFYLGDWQVAPASNSLRLGKTSKTIEPKAMDVLLLLCQQTPDVLSADDIVKQCWGAAEIGDNPVHKAISQLRTALGDSASAPIYIETIRKRGYRVVAEVRFPQNDAQRAESTQWIEKSPFPGLSAFQPEEAGIFFGRHSQVNQVLANLTRQIERGRSFTLLLGPSGSGKSSLINAGVLSKLLDSKGYNGIWVVSYCSVDFADVRQGQLLLDLASAMIDWDIDGQPVFSGQSAEQLAHTLEHDPHVIMSQCQSILAQVVATGEQTQPHLFVFIDRLEVLLSSPYFSAKQRNEFLAIIELFANTDGIIVFSACRNDFYPQVVLYPSLMKDKQLGAHFDLVPPSTSELSQMIRLPAIAADVSWSIDHNSGLSLDELLLNEASQHPDSLPLLQYTLQELYLQRNGSNQLDATVYHQLGGIEGAIGRKAETVFSQLAAENQHQLSHILSLLVTISDDGNTITSRAARWEQLNNSKQKQLVEVMVENRLFVTHLQQQTPSFSVAHEALLRRWSRVSDWIAAHKHGLTVKNRLQQQSKRWLDDNRSQDFLLVEGKPLDDAVALMDDSTFTLQPAERDLIHASRQRAKQKRWLKRGTLVLLCVLTLTSVFMSFRSQRAEQQAQQKRLEAESLLGFMVGEFADKLRSVKRMDLLDGISNKALEYFTNQVPQDEGVFSGFFSTNERFAATFQHAQTLAAMGEVAYSRGNNQEASAAFQSAARMLEQLRTRQPQHEEVLLTLGANAFWLGQLHYDSGEYDQAQQRFEQYRDVSTLLNQLNPNSVDAWMELSYAYNTLGSLAVKRQFYADAKRDFERSLELMEKVATVRSDDVNLQTDMADALSWLATIALHLGQVNSSLTLHSKGQAVLLEALQKEPNNAAIIESLMLLDWQQAKTYQYLGAFDKALPEIIASERYLQALLQQDPENQIWQRDLDSVKAFQLVLSGYADQFTDQPNALGTELMVSTLTPSSISLGALSDLKFYLLQSQQTGVVRQLQNLWRRYILEHEQLPNSPETSMLLANAYLIDAIEMQSTQRHMDKLQRCQQALSLLAPLVKKSQHPMFWLPYIAAQHCLDKQHEISESIQALQKQGVVLPPNHFTNP